MTRATAVADPDMEVPAFVVQHAQRLAAAGARLGYLIQSLQLKAKRPQPGRPSSGTEEHDRRITEAWTSGGHQTRADLAKALDLPERDVKRALDRERKRKMSHAEKPRSRGCIFPQPPQVQAPAS